MCGLLQYSFHGTRDAAPNWEEELASTLSELKLTRGSACPCVWQGCIKGEHVAATVHRDDIIFVGKTTCLGISPKKLRKYEIKKQVIGEGANLEKSGRILNRVIGWRRDGITILKDLELERANHFATPCVVERNKEGNARSDESEGENRREQERTQTKHELDDMSDGDDRDRPQMAGDDANDR